MTHFCLAWHESLFFWKNTFQNFFVKEKSLLFLTQNVGLILQPEERAQIQKSENWCNNFPTQLQIFSHTVCSLLHSCDVTTILWRSHWLCSHARHPKECAQHLLLDPLHLYHPKRILETHCHWRTPPRHWQNCRSWWKAIRQILPVGRLLSVLSGKENQLVVVTVFIRDLELTLVRNGTWLFLGHFWPLLM